MVNSMGGYQTLIQEKRWSALSKMMKFTENSSGRALRQHYERIIYPFIIFESGVTLPLNNNNNNNGEEESQESVSSKSTSNKKKTTKKKLTTEIIETIDCLICNRGDDESFILLCDGCDDSYHTYCLFPPLSEIPKGDWRCPNCVADICKKPSEAYCIETSTNMYTLEDFGRMANDFKVKYFDKTLKAITHDEVEEEFWRILGSPHESVVVEYGADLHTLELGSGFPSSKKIKQTTSNMTSKNYEEYLKSSWNLNNLPQSNKSVLSQMNVDISGMKIPWAYVGMCFSCFCWHVEDHWSYSINYLHFGEAKTWYGVSGGDAEKFEDAMKEQANELFKSSPDLLHHLNTIMNPYLLKQKGVPIHKIHQSAGEFVITFPRAYHAGFNQGFNFAEAVNFCPADWMPIGRTAIESYKLVKRHSVFSHDELVFKLANNSNCLDLKMASVIFKELETIINLEKKDRKVLVDRGVKKSRLVNFEIMPDDERTCCYCNTTCFVSAVTCSCEPNKLACLCHFSFLCSNNNENNNLNNNININDDILMNNNNNNNNKKRNSLKHEFTLLYRYTMNEMSGMLNTLNQLNDDYNTWCDKVKQILNCDKKNKKKNRPSLNEIVELVKEAKIKKYSTNELIFIDLKNELNKSLKCIETCQQFIGIYKNDYQKVLLFY
jgi:[histone H3]-trimethyl-L-lysine4 demethylase